MRSLATMKKRNAVPAGFASAKPAVRAAAPKRLSRSMKNGVTKDSHRPVVQNGRLSGPGKELQKRGGMKGDYFPPRFSFQFDASKVNPELVTFFLTSSDARAGKHFEKLATNWFQQGFRMVLVGKADLVSDPKYRDKVVGRLTGDHFNEAIAWLRTNILDELALVFHENGGGTAEEREQALSHYADMALELEQHQKELERISREMDRASEALVMRFGRQELTMNGATWDPCYAKEKVYWKKRGGKDFAG